MKKRAGVRCGVVLALTVLVFGQPPRPLFAQTDRPETVFSVTGGFTFDRALWALRQPVAVPVPGPLLLDTFLLARGLASGWSAWAGFTRYGETGPGWGGEVAWVAVGIRTGCAISGTPQPDPGAANLLACGRIPYAGERTSALALLATATRRVWPRRAVSPFVKAGVGFALLGGSFVAVRSKFSVVGCADCVRTILEPDTRVVTWAATLAAGLSLGGDAAQRLRIEARDFVLGLPVVAGPADPVAEHPVPRTRSRAHHRFTLGIGLDLDLGGRHRKRY